MTKTLRAGWGVTLQLFLFTTLFSTRILAENTNVTYAPIPDWVRPAAWTERTTWPTDSKSDGTRCLLYEEQDYPKISGDFFREVDWMENESGVQNSGSLRIDFEAEFQQLCLHRVVIHRGGKTINCLNPAKVRVIQPESELGDDMFTGRKTAVLFIEDLRVGDILEYAYTLSGENPVLNGHFSSSFDLQTGSPVEHELYRVVWDSPKPLQLKMHLTDFQPTVKPWGAGMDYLWESTDLPAITDEDDKPAGYEIYPYLEVSDFTNWQEVVDWALPLYESNPTNLPPEIEELLARWQSASSADEERARLALQFVQDEIRYTGIELGPDSYRPADPVDTFQQRYGDCKGKVVLLRFLLQQMHIPSRPALVNSSVHEAIADRLPSPFAFDHVILQINLAGKDVWVDPTYSRQGGPLLNRFLPPYGKALLIYPGNAALADVPLSRPENAWQQRAVSTFTIKSYDLPVAYTVRTEYRGASADDMRDQLAGTDPKELAKNYLNYYARSYPGIAGDGPMQVTDDRAANVLTVVESYTITNLWTRDDSGKPWEATFYADNLENTLTDPDTRLRKTPLALTYPSLHQQEIIVQLPDKGWDIPETETNLEDDSFSFNYHRRLFGTRVTYTYECRTKEASIPAARVPGYLAKREKMENLLSDSLQRSTPTDTNGANWLMIGLAILGSGVTAAAGIIYWRRLNAVTEAAPPVLTAEPKLQGLGGWLILAGIGVCLAPFVRLYPLVQNWQAYFSMEVWRSVAQPQGASYHPLYGPLLMGELLGNLFLFGLNVLVICLFFTKRKAFPRLYIVWMLCYAAFGILDDIGCQLIPSLRSSAPGQDHSVAIRAVLTACFWCAYMVKSRRVKATFVR